MKVTSVDDPPSFQRRHPKAQVRNVIAQCDSLQPSMLRYVEKGQKATLRPQNLISQFVCDTRNLFTFKPDSNLINLHFLYSFEQETVRSFLK